jgi:hypothetical protein
LRNALNLSVRSFKPLSAIAHKKAPLSRSFILMVGPTGLLRHLRIPETQHPLLEYCVKPACSQLQTSVGHRP